MLLAMGVSIAHAAFHLFKIQQIYSNADGTVQFVVLTSFVDGEDRWSGHYIASISLDQKTEHSYPFANDLPDGSTAGKSVLVATQGFASLGLIKPDFVVANNFVVLGDGSVDFAGVDSISYSAGQIPTDGVKALFRDGSTKQNVAMNFAGATASVSVGGPSTANYQGIWWKSPGGSEDGWGINFAHQADTIFASWFTYDTTGKGWWLVMTADKTAPGTYSGKLYTTHGPAFNAVPFDPNAVVATEAGTGTLTFTDTNNGTFAYVVGAVTQSKAITRQVFGALPTCTFGTQPNLALATNYQDLWWRSPGGSESGWGINLNHQGDTIFATWFTYDLDGTPMWLVVSAQKTGTGVYSGDLYRTSGTRFDNFNGANIVPVKVGTATFTFANGNSATFAYTVQVAGMTSAVTQSKAITREIFAAPGTACN
jgi:hypothetical protein